MNRYWIQVGVTVGSFLALALAILYVVDLWRLQANLDRANQEIAAGQWESARARLTWLSSRWPFQPEVEYQLGVCHRALGDADAALAAWARVPTGTRWTAQATFSRAQALIEDRGRFSEAERLLEPVGRGSEPVSAQARQWLVRLYYWQGRQADILRLLETEWNRGDHRPALLRELWRLDADPPSIGMIQDELDRAGRKAPEDERVWLGRANLATRSGKVAEAARWLNQCFTRKPDDPAVWRARLAWALAADRGDEARTALLHLSVDVVSPTEVLDLRAWCAGHRGLREAERIALEKLIDLNPGAAQALERLAILAFEAGRTERAAELRRRKAEIDEVKERYRQLLAPDSPTADPEELGRLAETLGRWFEARGWNTLASRHRPAHPPLRDALDRLERRAIPQPESQHPSRMWNDLLADLDRMTRARQFSGDQAQLSSPPPYFRDDAEAVGLRFRYQNGQSRAHHLPETMGGGVALLDYDGDGWLDVYVVQGGPFPTEATQAPPDAGDRLFHNRGDGTFEDATSALGIDRLPRGYGHGVTVGDYDNDGDPDLFITRWRSYALFRNDGSRFVDVTAAAGLGGDRDWPTSSAFADLDGDGDLDLYVCHYLAWDPDHPLPCPTNPPGEGYAYCDPRKCTPLPDHLFRNEGARFVDVTAEAGIEDRHGRGLGVVAADLDGDGRIDIYVANDTTANALWRNRGGMKFDDVGLTAGVACNASGGFQAGMGVACGDLDGDGLPDLAVTNFYGESTTFYRNLGRGIFTDRTSAIGLAAPSRFLLGFGIALLDFNNDGQLDLITANGHVNDFRPSIPHAMSPQLLAGNGNRLHDVSELGGPCFRVPRVGRGLATGDLDHDGRVDAIMVCQDTPLVYLHNLTEGGHFVTFQLEGTASNRDAVGTRVSITLAGRRQTAWRTGGGSYQSAVAPGLHFGLGSHDRIDLVEVLWPSGRSARYQHLVANRGYLLREGEAQPKTLAGYPRQGGRLTR